MSPEQTARRAASLRSNYDYVLNLPAIASLGRVPVAMSEKNPTEGAA
jgi:hypothetical protein